MADHVQANIMKLCSNLNVFRVAEKYADVTIRCDNENFKCHRIILALASNFFDTMLSSSFKESTEEIISLPKTNAQTFKDILQFIYTGDVIISHENVLNILEGSDFFELPGIRDLCIEFIKKNKMNVQNTMESFMFAFKTNQQILIDILSNDIAEQLEIFSYVSYFLELSFNEFNIIISKYKSFKEKQDQNMLMTTITRWIFQHPEDRRQYFYSTFFRTIEDFNRVKYEMMNLGSELYSPASNHANELVCQSDHCGLINHQASITNESMRDSRDVLQGLREKKKNNVTTEESLHVYVRYAEEKLMRVFAINQQNDCALLCEIPISCRNQWMKIVALDNYLYSFHYIRRNPAEASTSSQLFYAHNSVDMSFTFRLKSPPIIFDDVSMCSSQNNIYVYNQTLSHQIPTNSPNVSFFTDEEVSNGIYVYNCEVDNWFPVPVMKTKLKDSCMTVCNNVLYLIGGHFPDSGVYSKMMQTYDYRAGTWNILQDTPAYFVGSECCVMGSCIYVCGGRVRNNCIECYDVSNWSWKERYSFLKIDSERSMVHHCFKTYAGKLLSMGGYTEGITSNDLSILAFSLSTRPVYYDSILTESTQNNISVISGTILDAVVFKSV